MSDKSTAVEEEYDVLLCPAQYSAKTDTPAAISRSSPAQWELVYEPGIVASHPLYGSSPPAWPVLAKKWMGCWTEDGEIRSGSTRAGYARHWMTVGVGMDEREFEELKTTIGTIFARDVGTVGGPGRCVAKLRIRCTPSSQSSLNGMAPRRVRLFSPRSLSM
ncbi:hypothetical protein CABS01_06277 [Colletotrichum abscissum]|uniref:Uncharacterized protein n=1 Tax=Colletotrichum abscissum TaxID=1671311 RepID=A0A9P9X712_9PEZI|nr:uncharacterized protein CABS01_06277 [Colletotrichum abscissum]KAI3539651.1 hypothetical protein CABS02_11315 [Colletotrichum abscissum]KAK1516310.1 hypothetical protein CABS01_06277 [Colletotrichum abscissum]